MKYFRVSEAGGARRGLTIYEDEALGVAPESAAGENEVCEVLEESPTLSSRAEVEG